MSVTVCVVFVLVLGRLVVERFELEKSEVNARRCLDLVLTCELKRQEHHQQRDSVSITYQLHDHSELGDGELTSHPREGAPVVHTVQAGYVYRVRRVIKLSNPDAVYQELLAIPQTMSSEDTRVVVSGFLRSRQMGGAT